MSTGTLFSDEKVKSWSLWYDYETRTQRLLLGNSVILYFHALVVFFIALCAKNIALLVTRGLQLLGLWLTPTAVDQDEPTEHTLLLSDHTSTDSDAPPEPDYQTASNGDLADSSIRRRAPPERSVQKPPSTAAPQFLPLVTGGRDSTRNAALYVARMKNPHRTWTIFCWGILMLQLFCVLAFSVFAPKLMTSGKSALWSSNVCGLWAFPTAFTTPEDATRRNVVLRRKEARAGEYAKYCYDSPSALQPLPVYCSFFAHQQIPFDTKRTHKCPFKNRDVCQGADVVTFDTGYLPASMLGINQKNPRRFRRTATCAPLNVSEPYVRRSIKDGDEVYHYHYGNKVESDEPLFNTTGNPFNWTVPTYDVSAFSTGPGIDGFWTPIDDLQTHDEEALTLLLIRPLKIFYLRSSDDPVFPADVSHTLPEGDVWYVKGDSKARALACTDKTELCDPEGQKGGKCWAITHRPDIIRDDRGYWLMKLALKESTIYDSIALRLGTALVAQEMISQQNSLPLPDDHWIDETKRLFQTSLALAQIRTWSISSGEDHAHETDYGWENQTPDEAEESGGLCNLLKFNSVGYTDLDFNAFLLLLILPYVLTAILSTSWRTCCSFVGKKQDAAQPGVEEEPAVDTALAISRGNSPSQAVHRPTGGSVSSGSAARVNGEERRQIANVHTNSTGTTLKDDSIAPEVHDERLVIERLFQFLGHLFEKLLSGGMWLGRRLQQGRA